MQEIKSVFKVLDTDFKKTMGRDQTKTKTKEIDKEQTKGGKKPFLRSLYIKGDG